MNPHFLRIADLTVAFSTRDPSLHIGPQGAAKRFAVAESTHPDVTVDVSWMEATDPIGIEEAQLRFDSGGIWKLYEQQNEFLFVFSSPRFIGGGVYKLALFDKDFCRGQVRLVKSCYPPGESIYPLEYPLDELLMLNLLGRGRGVELHACGIVDGAGQGFLFCGQSGAGKSTTAGLWQKDVPGAEVLSDDRIVIRKESGTYFMYGTPWHGDAQLSQAKRAPLSRVFVLKQGRQNGIQTLSAATAAAELFARSFPAFHDSSALDFTVQFLSEMSDQKPCELLTFVRDSSAVEFVRRSVA